MECRDLAQCYTEIDAYLHGEPTGYTMLINTECLDSHVSVMSRLASNPEIDLRRISDETHDDRLPDIDALLGQLCTPGKRALIGLSQYLMLRSSNDMGNYINKIVHMNIHGRLVVLLYHCDHLLRQWDKRDIRLKNRMLFISEKPSGLPQISVISTDASVGKQDNCCSGIQGLLARLECLTSNDLIKQPVIGVQTGFSATLFNNSVYSVEDGNDFFARLIKKHPELAGCERSYGTALQWEYLLNELKSSEDFAALLAKRICAVSNLQSAIGDVYQDGDKNKLWLLWLGLKLYGTANNRYLALAVECSKQVEDFEECLMMTLLEVKHTDDGFADMFSARKRLLNSMPENLPLITRYCQKTGRFEKDAVYYLTDSTEAEEHELMRLFGTYEYSEDELLQITGFAFAELHKYLLPFKFTPANMLLPEGDSELRDALSLYFRKYKQQKLTNRIWPEFMQTVLQYADERPYNKLPARSTLAAKMDKKGAQLFFFDALGVEYLSYIANKCEQYGLIADISVGVCQLPSITEKNKEFVPYFPGGSKKIDALDELKHHSQIYDYQRCKEPIHLFRELEVIDEQLRQIRSLLVQGVFDKGVIISDHGASRLAVINNEQSNSTIELDEKGEHSGRCCPAEADPGIEYAAYTDGYVVLANYERFKGGRPANVEVHGGASLEEVLVPLITITPRPCNIEIVFVEDIIQLKGKEPVAITVFANTTINDPILAVDVNGTERTYHGEFVGDQRHAKFVMEDIKRSKKYFADFYDGAKKLESGLTFTVQKGTKENASLGI